MLVYFLQNFQIEDSFVEYTRTSIPKLLLIQGDFGTGKTTFTLRSINEYLTRSDCTLAFEIVNPLNLKRGYISKLIESASATQYIFYCDNIETDSVFKSFLDLRVQLASEQNGDIKIVFISSIRENILEKFLNQTRMNISNHFKIPYNPVYSDDELQILVENLKEVGLVKYRDVTEKDSLVSTIRQNYRGDSFITLYKLIEGGVHYRLLERAYDELSADMKIAFKYTALVHRFNMLCPVGVIKNAIKNTNWNEFTEKVVKGDGKGILFQVTKLSTKNEPDLYFKTKHPVIAEALIDRFLKNKERNSLYKNIFESLVYSDANAGFIVDLIKNIRNKDSSISKGQIENYFEIARKEFESSPHFMLAYVTNMEKNNDSIEVLQKCIKDITFLESSLEKRNHRLTHRKGSICFKIARTIFYKDRGSLSVIEWVEEAEEWFDIKKRMDPLSEYSYLDYFSLLIWKLKNIKLNNREKLDTLKTLNVLFDEAYRTLSSNTDAINSLFKEYNSVAGNYVNGSYVDFLLEQYQEPSTRPWAAMLLYYYYEQGKKYHKCRQLFDEIKNYSDDKDVVNFLFKEYGRSLHLVNNRLKFFELIGKNDYLKEESQLRYYYFSAISEFYNHRWGDGWENLNKLKNERSYNLNPDFFLSWKNENGEPEIFEGEIMRDRTNKKVKILSPFFKSFNLVKGNYGKYQINQPVKVTLKFFLDGVKAEIYNEETLSKGGSESLRKTDRLN